MKHNAPKRKELLCDDTETKYFHLKEDRRGLDYVLNIKSRKQENKAKHLFAQVYKLRLVNILYENFNNILN